MKYSITITAIRDHWTRGTYGPFEFEVKHWPEPSVFGIDEGRISKLWVTRRTSYTTVAAYDRGWDRLPRFDDEMDAVSAIIDRFN